MMCVFVLTTFIGPSAASPYNQRRHWRSSALLRTHVPWWRKWQGKVITFWLTWKALQLKYMNTFVWREGAAYCLMRYATKPHGAAESALWGARYSTVPSEQLHVSTESGYHSQGRFIQMLSNGLSQQLGGPRSCDRHSAADTALTGLPWSPHNLNKIVSCFSVLWSALLLRVRVFLGSNFDPVTICHY
jgi:hypothetical protein